MPCKVVHKRYSNSKSAKAEGSGHDGARCSESASCLNTTGSTSGVESFLEASTQTDLCARHISSLSTTEVSTQTGLYAVKLNTAEAATQTDSLTYSTSTCTTCIQTEDTAVTCHSVSHTSHQSGKCVTTKYYHTILLLYFR